MHSPEPQRFTRSVVDEDECVGCNLCEIVCPVPDCISMEEVDNGFGYSTLNKHVTDGETIRPKKASHGYDMPDPNGLLGFKDFIKQAVSYAASFLGRSS